MFMSFMIGVVFGYTLDVCRLLVAPLPFCPLPRVVYFLAGTGILITGVAFLMISNLPIMPQDLFTREISAHFSLPFKVVKTVFDLSCVSLSLAVAFLALGRIAGRGGRDPGERAYHGKMRGCGKAAAIIH